MNTRFVKVGSVMLLVIAGASLLAPIISAPFVANDQPFTSPSRVHPFGTDDVGHDVLRDLLYGGRTSLLVGITVGLATTTIGLVVFLSLFGWPLAARRVRPFVKSLRNSGFVEAAQSIGAGEWYIIRRHIFPQLYSLFAVQVVLDARLAVLAESGLGFLGLEDPTTKSWGMMLSFAFNHQATFLSDAWKWTVMPAAIVLSIFILSLSLIGVGLESLSAPVAKVYHLLTALRKTAK